MISYDSSQATSTKIETYVTDFMTELNILIVLNERLIMQSLYKSVKKSAQTDAILSLWTLLIQPTKCKVTHLANHYSPDTVQVAL